MVWIWSVTPALAHGGEPHRPGYPWTFDPWIVVPLGVFAALYCVGAARLAGRTASPRSLLPHAALCCAGVAALAGALLSPLHWLGEHLFTFHMIEHEIIMAVAAPLIVLARPVGVLLWGLQPAARRVAGAAMRAPAVRRIWRWCAAGVNATILHGVAIWAWHVPALFDAAVTNTTMHRLQHLSFFATALLFWWAIIWCCDHGSAAWHLFVTMIHTGILGSLMALAPRVLYVAQTQTASDWDLTPIEDQQLAGMIMWIPAGAIYAAAALAMLAMWIRASSDRREPNV